RRVPRWPHWSFHRQPEARCDTAAPAHEHSSGDERDAPTRRARRRTRRSKRFSLSACFCEQKQATKNSGKLMTQYTSRPGEDAYDGANVVAGRAPPFDDRTPLSHEQAKDAGSLSKVGRKSAKVARKQSKLSGNPTKRTPNLAIIVAERVKIGDKQAKDPGDL